jgi:hypothetical protein
MSAARDYAAAIYKTVAQRAGITAAEEAWDELFEPARPVAAILYDLQERVRGIADGADGIDGWTGPDLDYLRERVALAFWHERELPPIETHCWASSRRTSRILLGGPTGIGKTNVLMAAAWRWAADRRR